MKLARLLAAATALLLSVGCKASGPLYSEIAHRIPELEADQGRVVVYRSGSIVGSGVQPKVWLNDEEVGKSAPAGFFFVDAEPGDYSIRCSTEVDRALTFVLGPNETRYVRSVVSMGFMVGHVTPELVDPAEGALEIQEMHYTGSEEALLPPAAE